MPNIAGSKKKNSRGIQQKCEECYKKPFKDIVSEDLAHMTRRQMTSEINTKIQDYDKAHNIIDDRKTISESSIWTIVKKVIPGYEFMGKSRKVGRRMKEKYQTVKLGGDLGTENKEPSTSIEHKVAEVAEIEKEIAITGVTETKQIEGTQKIEDAPSCNEEVSNSTLVIALRCKKCNFIKKESIVIDDKWPEQSLRLKIKRCGSCNEFGTFIATWKENDMQFRRGVIKDPNDGLVSETWVDSVGNPITKKDLINSGD